MCIRDRDKALRKNMLLDAARKQLFKYMEAEGIWYMPLKGSIIKDLYKKPGMREMSDNDILFDPAYSRKIRFYMEEHGYQTESYGVGAHDTYLKEPVYNFEMHRVLFSEKPGAEWNQYYQDVKDRLIKDGSNSFGYHFEENDLYIYVIAHAYKHHKGSGTGIRTLTDCYILNEAYVDHFDYEYIGQELAVFGASEFEQTLRSLAHKIFASEDMGQKNRLTEQERELLTEQAGKLGITDRIRFLGYVEGEPLRELYHNADVFILPTREDCFGLVILEAMCASLPVISSKYADGAFDLVAEGENGYIVDPEDTHAFAEKIDQIFADENRLKEMGTRSYERAHAFAFEEVAKGCIDALCYVMGKAVR